MPIELADLVSGGEKQYCNTEAGPVCAGDVASNKHCITRSLGPIDYFDKLVTVQFWRVGFGNQPYTTTTTDMNFIG